MIPGLLRAELVKQARRPRTWAALAFVAVVPIIITIAIKLNPPSPPDPGNGGEGASLFYLGTHTGLLVPAVALRVMSTFFLVVVIMVFAGDAVASDAAWGNLRSVLARPVGRARLLVAKAAVAALFGLLATVLVVVTGLVAGVLAFGWHPLSLGFASGLRDLGVGDIASQSQGELLWHLVLATVLVVWGLAGITAFAFMVSTMTDTPAAAIFSAVGLYVMAQILGAVEPLGAIRYGLPVYYYDSWRTLFFSGRFTDDMWRSILLQIPYVAVFGTIS